MIFLQRLIQLQFLYYALGMLFNFVSMYGMAQGDPPLTSNDPYMGCLSMTLYAFFLMPGLKQKVVLYRILMLVAVILIGYGGVVKHYFTYQESPELYASATVAMIGAGINLFGLILNLIAAGGLFKTN